MLFLPIRRIVAWGVVGRVVNFTVEVGHFLLLVRIVERAHFGISFPLSYQNYVKLAWQNVARRRHAVGFVPSFGITVHGYGTARSYSFVGGADVHCRLSPVNVPKSLVVATNEVESSLGRWGHLSCTGPMAYAARMRLLACALLLVLATSGCDKGSSRALPDAAAPSAAVSAPPAPAPPPRTADLDAAQVRQPLKCTASTKRPICQVIDDFEKGTAWNLETIRGTDARYFGQATVVEKGTPRDAWYFLVVKKVPTNEALSGDIPIKVAIRELDSALKPENAHAPRLLRAVEHDDSVNKLNRTAEYVRTYAPSSWDGAAPTAGPSSLLYSEGGMFVREGKGRRLHVIRLAPASSDTSQGDGLYATLYPLSW